MAKFARWVAGVRVEDIRNPKEGESSFAHRHPPVSYRVLRGTYHDFHRSRNAPSPTLAMAAGNDTGVGGIGNFDRDIIDSGQRSRGSDAPGLCKGSRDPQEEGAGNAGCECTRSLVCSVESTRVSYHEYTGAIRHSPRDDFSGFLRALPGDRACLPPSFLRSVSFLRP